MLGYRSLCRLAFPAVAVYPGHTVEWNVEGGLNPVGCESEWGGNLKGYVWLCVFMCFFVFCVVVMCIGTRSIIRWPFSRGYPFNTLHISNTPFCYWDVSSSFILCVRMNSAVSWCSGIVFDGSGACCCRWPPPSGRTWSSGRLTSGWSRRCQWLHRLGHQAVQQGWDSGGSASGTTTTTTTMLSIHLSECNMTAPLHTKHSYSEAAFSSRASKLKTYFFILAFA